MAVSRCLASAALLLAADGFRVVQKKQAGEENESPEGMSWGLTRIGADTRGRSGGGVTIFVVDSGVRVSHNEFEGRAAPAVDMTLGELWWPYEPEVTECNGDLNCAPDERGWGTGHAGFAAGKTYGVAPGALVRSVKVRGARDVADVLEQRLAAGLKWVATSSARPAVALLPWVTRNHAEVSSALDAMVNSGVTLVVAAGESSGGYSPRGGDACTIDLRASSYTIVVGMVDDNEMAPAVTTFGECINMWAPARAGLRSAWHTSDTATNTFNRHPTPWSTGSGTSASFVAGGAALVLAADPTKSPAKVLSELSNNARRGCVGRAAGVSGPNLMLWVGEGEQPACRGCPDNCSPGACRGYGRREICSAMCEFCR